MKNIFTLIAIAFINLSLFAQVAINTDGSDADPSAMLEIKSSDKGLLLPRLTSIQINSISNPANGLMVFNTDDNSFYTYIADDNEWKEIAYGTNIIPGVFVNCGDPLYDSRDGQTYSTVEIGIQCWMQENLNIGNMINGSSDQTDNSIIEKYCYNNNTSNCDVYGGLYRWNEAMQYNTTEETQGICPIDWHIPSDAEWTQLTDLLGGTNLAGGKMKEIGTTHWHSPNVGADNSSGFTALPGGYFIGSFGGMTLEIDFWSSTETSSSNAKNRYLHYSYASVFIQDYSKTGAFYIRCIKD